MSTRAPATCHLPPANRYLPFAFVLLAVLLFAACRVAPPEANGFAIVAVDPASGDVGVAGASCSQYPFDYRAALRPHLGAAAQLGIASPLQRDRVSAWIAQPQQAPTVVHRLTRKSNDPDLETRQYGVVTLQDGTAQASVHLGKETAGHAAAESNSTGSAVVVGGGMANGEVAARTLAAFKETTSGALPLSDRLVRALEAGSAAGGLRLCNRNGVEQTASTAFVMQARSEDPNFQVTTLGNRAADEPAPPFLALSVTEPVGGRNAIMVLRSEYETWRASHLPPCAECAQARITVPEGGSPAAARDEALANNALWLVAGFIVVVMLLTISYFIWRPHSGRSIRAS